MAPTTITKAFESLNIKKNFPEAPAIEGLRMLLERAAPVPKLVLRKRDGAFPTVEDEKRITHQVALFEHGVGAEFNQYRLKLKTVLAELRKTVSRLFPDAKIWATGSFPANVDLPTSDIDVTMEIPSLDGEPRKLSVIRAAMEGQGGPFQVKKIVGGRVPVLALMHKATKVPVDVTMDNGAPKRNTQLLIWYGQVDRRFVPLCRAIKSWASQTGVENSMKGRLNSCSICLMVIHYLQCGVTPAVLPSLQAIFPELNGEIEIDCEESKRRDLGEELRASGWAPTNQESLGALYLGFFRYFAKFDFINQMISVKNGCSMPKPKKNDEKDDTYALRYTVIEDPFMNPLFNCARTVNQGDIFERLVSEFEKALGFIKCHKTIFFQKSFRRVLMEREGEERDMMDFNTINIPKDNWHGDKEKPSKFWNKKIQMMRCRFEEWPEQFQGYP
ncbi:hypothetical protein CAEBREN_10930 [Caenorhabditis brenneri]|uniref:Uncharacterized protein n=1 Tax=Caenorhabditis brenneri TaxID=135651 RepID=G0MWM8_CAEBE|nr:hypothetical protein CAEBREN_10930 [Caenorhabditis brenneri]